jgi:hypothetical protein
VCEVAKEKLMNSPTPEEVTEKSLSVESALDSAHTKIEFDAERIRSSIALSVSNSIDDLEKLTSELQQLLEFLKSETERVQDQSTCSINSTCCCFVTRTNRTKGQDISSQ